MEHGDIIVRINDRIDSMHGRLESMREENERLQREIVTLRAASEAKDNEIRRLQEENGRKEHELEEIVRKIDQLLG